jgi:hypothetical protein
VSRTIKMGQTGAMFGREPLCPVFLLVLLVFSAKHYQTDGFLSRDFTVIYASEDQHHRSRWLGGFFLGGFSV